MKQVIIHYRHTFPPHNATEPAQIVTSSGSSNRSGNPLFSLPVNTRKTANLAKILLIPASSLLSLAFFHTPSRPKSVCSGRDDRPPHSTARAVEESQAQTFLARGNYAPHPALKIKGGTKKEEEKGLRALLWPGFIKTFIGKTQGGGGLCTQFT